MLLLVPAVWAGLTAVTDGRIRTVVAGSGAVASAAATFAFANRVLSSPGAAVVGRDSGLQLRLVADGLAATMLVMTAVVVLAVAAFAMAEDTSAAHQRHRAYWPLLFGVWVGFNGVFVAGDLLTAYVFLEVAGVCGAVLVTLQGGRASLLAGTRYLYVEVVASTTVIAGVAVIWWQAGTIALQELGAGLADAPVGLAGLAMVTAGLLLKVPLVPLHFWLPAAHTHAPSAVSPVLSAVMVKSAFAVMVRLWFLPGPDLVTTEAALLLGLLGSVAVLWGSVNALAATELKRLVAASTVAQIGLMFLLPPLVLAGSRDGWIGGIVLAVAHAPAKAAMLMAAVTIVEGARHAGVVEDGRHVAGEGQVDARAPEEPAWPTMARLRGSAARRPLATMAFGVGGLSLVGLPPTGGFIGKWYLLLGSIDTGQWWWAVVISIATLLTAAYLMRVVRPAFAPSPETRVVRQRDARDVVALVLAATAVLVGVRPALLVDLLSVGAPLGGG